MMTAKEAKKRTDDYVDEILASEVPVFLKNICEVINKACEIGEYKCTVLYDNFHSVTVANVMVQLVDMGYRVDNTTPSQKILISWM